MLPCPWVPCFLASVPSPRYVPFMGPSRVVRTPPFGRHPSARAGQMKARGSRAKSSGGWGHLSRAKVGKRPISGALLCELLSFTEDRAVDFVDADAPTLPDEPQHVAREGDAGAQLDREPHQRQLSPASSRARGDRTSLEDRIALCGLPCERPQKNEVCQHHVAQAQGH